MAWAEFRKTVNGVDKKFNKKTGQWEKGNWYAIGRDPKTGDRISEPAGIKANIKKAAAKIEQIEIGEVLRTQSVPLKIAYDQYEINVKKINKPGTWKAYNWGLEKLLEFFKPNCGIDSIKKPDMIKFRTSIMQAHSINGMIDILKYARVFFGFCVEAGFIQINPAKGITKGLKAQDVAVFLTDDQIRLILSCHNDPNLIKTRRPQMDAKGEFEDIIKTALLTGMREGDIVKFRADSIKDGNIFISKGKHGKSRVIPINSKLKPIIDKYLARGTEFIFQGWCDYRIRQRWIRLYARARKANPELPKRCRFHDLRHTFASNYLRGGGTIADLKMILGHSSINDTVRYSHFQESDLHSKMEKLKSDFMDAVPTKFYVA